MEELLIVAILDRSAGNSEVGEMWQETKVFKADTPVFEILKWASKGRKPEEFRGRLQLTIAQD